MENTSPSSSGGDPAVDILQDHIAALRTLRRVRTALLLLLLLCMMCPIGLFAAVQSGQMQAWAVPTDDGGGVAVRRVVEAGMQLADLLAHAAAMLLIVVYFLGINVCLVGRLGSGRDAMVAFFWMIILLLLLGAWTSAVLGPVGPRMFSSLETVSGAALAPGADWRAVVVHYVSFLGLPVLGILAAVVADMRFGRTYSHAIRRVRERMGITAQG